jgi:hypothetical protein
MLVVIAVKAVGGSGTDAAMIEKLELGILVPTLFNAETKKL